MKKIILKIGGMTCSACSSGLEKYLLKQDGIEDALVNLVMATASITYDEKVSEEDLDRFVAEAGFKSLGEFDISAESKEDNKKRSFIVNGFLLILVLYISMSKMLQLPVIPFLNMETKPLNYGLFLIICEHTFINDVSVMY